MSTSNTLTEQLNEIDQQHQSIANDKQMFVDQQMQSEERLQVARRVMERFYEVRQLREQVFSYFRDRTLIDYIDDSVKRINQHKVRPSYKKWWQANTASATTRNKLISILANLAGQMMEVTVRPAKEVDMVAMKKARVSTSLLKAANIKNNDDKQLIWEMFEAMAKGTVVGFEGWKYGRRMIREIKNEDIKTGELKFKEKEVKLWNDVYGEIVPLEDIYFGNIYVSDISDDRMPDIFWRQIIKYSQFKNDFADYEDSGLVQPKSNLRNTQEDQPPFYLASDVVNDDEVEILRYFNKDTDEFVMLANGIWINCLGTEKNPVVSPLPFNHKKLPFWIAQFEIIDNMFIYGKSIADKLIADQDTYDKFWDNILDRALMALKAPIVISGGLAGSLADGYLEPDSIIELEEGQNAKAERLNLGDPGMASFQILQILERRMADVPTEPTGSRQRKTATEVALANESTIKLLSLFLRLMEFAIRDKYKLRLANLFQFYTQKSHNKDKDGKFRRIILKNEMMANGRVGTVQVNFVSKINQSALDQQGMMNPEAEIIEITPDFIRNFDTELIITPRSSVRDSETLIQAKEINFQKVMIGMYPEMFNKEVGFVDLVSKFPDKDPDRLKKIANPGQSAPGIPGSPGGGPPGTSANNDMLKQMGINIPQTEQPMMQ